MSPGTPAARSLAGLEAVSGLRDKLAYAGAVIVRTDDRGVAAPAGRVRQALALARRQARSPL